MSDPPRERPLPLVVRGLTRRYGNFVAVDALDLEVRAGEIVGFLGPNGAGKTTTLRCVSGLLRPDSGTIAVAGHRLDQAPRPARAAMGFVPDRPFFYERLSAREFLEFVAALYEQPVEPEDGLRQSYPLLVRALANVVLCYVPSSGVSFTTMERGHYRVEANGGPPLAVAVAAGRLDGLAGVAIGYAPLLVLAFRFKAGAAAEQEI